MPIPALFITETELRRNTGERGSRKYVAYHGVVYDVTDCPKWRLDLHENQHFPGQDWCTTSRCRPMILHTFQTGNADVLSDWAAGLKPPARGGSFFNVLATPMMA